MGGVRHSTGGIKLYEPCLPGQTQAVGIPQPLRARSRARSHTVFNEARTIAGLSVGGGTHNARKHGVRFELAATVFRDPLALSRYDEGHSEQEERWVTLGQAESGMLLVVVHTFEQASANEARVRIISARPATGHDRRHYENAH